MTPIFLSMLGEAYGVARRTADVSAIVAELNEREARGEYIAPFARVMLYAGVRDRASIVRMLQSCIAEDASWFTLNVAMSSTLTYVVRGDRELEAMIDQIYGGPRPAAPPVT